MLFLTFCKNFKLNSYQCSKNLLGLLVCHIYTVHQHTSVQWCIYHIYKFGLIVSVTYSYSLFLAFFRYATYTRPYTEKDFDTFNSPDKYYDYI